MKQFFIVTSTILSCIVTQAQLKIIPNKLSAGKAVSFDYSGKLASEDGTEFKVFYLSKTTNLYPMSFEKKIVDGKITGQIALPDSAKLLAFSINNGEDADNNGGKGYIFPILTNGKEDAYTKIQKIQLTNPYSLPSQILGLENTSETLPADYEAIFKVSPNLKSQFFLSYIYGLLLKKETDKASTIIRKSFSDSLQYGKTESGLVTYSNLLNNTLKKGDPHNKIVNDSLVALIVKKYPNGETAARQELTKKISPSVWQNTDSAVLVLEQMSAKYPSTKPVFYGTFAQKAILSAAEKDQDQAAMKLIPYLSANQANSIAWDFAETGTHLDLAAAISKHSLDETAEGSKKNKPTYYTSQEWEKYANSSYASNEDTYALILFKQGKKAEALAAQEDALKKQNWKSDPEMNERYLQYLLANGKDQEVVDKGKLFVENGVYNAKVKSYLSETYTKLNPGKNLDSYFAEMDAKAKEKILAKTRKSLINLPGKKFSLKDTEGNTVNIDDYKGKIVILDFWATWCGPCKMSFPGMQLAINQYKEDPEVAFLFIDTWEDNEKGAKQFVIDNKYSFHVLYDAKDTAGKYQVVTDFGITGIPTKFVLDKEGNIRFKMVGFSGSDEKVKNEVSSMVEVLKEEKKVASK